MKRTAKLQLAGRSVKHRRSGKGYREVEAHVITPLRTAPEDIQSGHYGCLRTKERLSLLYRFHIAPVAISAILKKAD